MAFKLRSSGDTHEIREVSGFFGLSWSLMGQPLLFGLLGASVSIDKLQPQHLVTGLYIVTIGLCLRVLATFICVRKGTDWNTGEIIFSMITWCPKV